MKRKLVGIVAVGVVLLAGGVWLYWRQASPPAGSNPEPAPGASAPGGTTSSGAIRSVSITEWHKLEHPDWTEEWAESWKVPTASQDVVLTTGRFTLELETDGYATLNSLSVQVTPALSVQRDDQQTNARVTFDGTWETAVVTATLGGGDPLKFNLRRVPETTVKASLQGEPQVGFDDRLFSDQFPTVTPGEKRLVVTFSKDVDRVSVERAIQRNLEEGLKRGMDTPVAVPALAFDWTGDREVAVRFTLTPNQPGVFIFSLATARDRDGGRLTSHHGMAFQVGTRVGLWTLTPEGKPQRLGRSSMGEGAISPDGKTVALSEVAYAMGDGWETAVWLVNRDGQRRYLRHGEYLTWVSGGLLLQHFGGGEARLIPQEALTTVDPASAARILPAPGGRRIWDATPEPGGNRIAYWLARSDEWPPRLDLRVVDPDGDWVIEDLTVGHTGDGFPQREPVVFAPDGSLYWLERVGQSDDSKGRLWHLSRQGRKPMALPAGWKDSAGTALVRWAGDDLVLAMGGQCALYNLASGTWRTLLKEDESWVNGVWVSPDGEWLALQAVGHQPSDGLLYRRTDLTLVGQWSGVGYGFDGEGTFYYGRAED